MKKYFSPLLLLILSLIIIALPARAEVGTVNFLSAGTITNNTTRTTGFSDVKVDDNEIVSLQINASGDAAGTGNLVLILARSKDGVTFETTPRQTVSFALAGATTIVGYTNLTLVGASHSLRLISVQNADASASATNVTVAVVKKRVSVR
jgi:hypothetical protein